MKKILTAGALACLSFAGASGSVSAESSKPNIIFILADDLGYGDVGVFYQNSRPANKPKLLTPQLDAMAAEGMMLRQHYSASPVCAPARASLLLGQHQGNAAIRDNQFDKALPNNHTLATALKPAGYYCMAIGKWGLAGEGSLGQEKELPAIFDPKAVPGFPLHRGFDEFFGFVNHGAGHVYYHDAKHPLYQDYTNVTSDYLNIYSTDLFFARAKKFVRDHEAAHPAQPFFLYLAPTAVHARLQVPGGPYPSGSGLHGGLQWPLAPTPDTANTWIHPDFAHAVTLYTNEVITNGPWSPTMKRYATMDRRLDDGVGDLLQLLRDLDIATNTLVIFSSDNGPANESDGGSYISDPRYFDSWANMDGIKRDLWEAGVREPTIAWWPGTIPAKTVSDTVSAFWDWLPTFAEISGQAPPAQADGVSLLPTLTGKGIQRHRGFFYFEYFFNGRARVDGGADGMFARKKFSARGQLQSVRVGDDVAVRYAVTNSAVPFRLYDVVTDPHEDHDLASDPHNAALLARVRDLVKQVRRPDPDAPRPYDNDLVPAVEAANLVQGKLNYAVYHGTWPWVPDFDALTPDATGQSVGLHVAGLAQTQSFGISYKGYLTVPADGQYTFYLTDDSGAQLWLHEAHLIDDDFNHTGAEISSSIWLQAGSHPIRLFYRHNSGPAKLNLEYSGPNLSIQPVPTTAFAVPAEK
ncbi:MAG TPA: sulfatase-like hydrolase/transferase [Verrucomicrobiae bacterium]|jgi:arylsulfatase A-like enzyme